MARKTRRPAARRAPARRAPARRAAPARRPAKRTKRTSSRRQNTIKIVVEQPGSTVSRPDITEDALVSSKIEKGKRRAKL